MTAQTHAPTLIVNARLINEGREFDADLRFIEGRIETISGNLSARPGEDVIDILATDHAPHTLEEKQQPYLRAPSGLPLVQFALNAALECVHEGRLTTAQVVQKFAHAPAQLFDVKERGFLREGYRADLVLIDDTPFTVEREQVLSKCGWSPFEGTTFRSRIASTWVNGHLVWVGRQLVGGPRGMRLEFER